MSQGSNDPVGPDDPGDGARAARQPSAGTTDPWSIVAYLLSGMLLWGGAGWLLDRWLGTSFLVLIGLLIGVALSLYLIYLRLGSS
jgi:F0F1-type ATP synthase assembly protein I